MSVALVTSAPQVPSKENKGDAVLAIYKRKSVNYSQSVAKGSTSVIKISGACIVEGLKEGYRIKTSL